MDKHTALFIAFFIMSGAAMYSCGNGNTHLSNEAATVSLTGSKQGQSVGFADVDGDGFDDKLVGAPYASLPSDVGAVLVYKGLATGYSAIPTLVLSDGDNFGYSLANVGDIDGDGKHDFAVGAISGSGDGTDEPSLSGTVTVYKGGGKGRIIRTIAGEGPLDKFGFSIAGGDVNGDGKSDIIVGAPFNTYDPALYQSGAVYAYFGPDLSSGVALHASTTNKGLGWMASAGDINGDGVADLLISATGKVLGFYGRPGFAPAVDSPDVVITSIASGFGKAIAVPGDLDGDGYGEAAIGAPNAVIGGNRDTGSVYIVKGGTGVRTVNVDAATPPPDLIVRIDGSGLFSRFGSSLGSVGDIDNDAKPDFSVGSPMNDVNPNDLSGRVYVFKGKDISASATLANSLSIDGMVKNQGFGTSLSAVKGRLLIGAPRSNRDTGGVAMVNPATGQAVTGGSSGGGTGGGGDCH